MNGKLDEFRVSTVARSSNWIWASWLNTASNGVFSGSFNTYDAVQPYQSANPVVANGSALNPGTNSVSLVCTLTSTGASPTTVFAFWATTDYTTNETDWITNGSRSNLGQRAEGEVFTNAITGLDDDTLYYYNFMASNTAGKAWGATSSSPSFQTRPIPLVRYVTPTGAGALSGADWDNAYGNVQDAVAAIGVQEGIVYIKSGIYSNAVTISITNAANLTLSGGYSGTGLDKDSAATVLTRNASAIRILYATNSTVTLDDVTVSGGALASLGKGGGLWAENSAVTITNCTFSNNGTANRVQGGAICADKGTLTIINSTFSLNGPTSDGGGYGYGGAIYALGGADVTLRRSVFSNNSLYCYGASKGGALYLTGGDYVIEGCDFSGNRFIDTSADDGVISLESATSILVSNCTFTANRAVDRQVSLGSAVLIVRGTCPSGALITDSVFEGNNPYGSYAQASHTLAVRSSSGSLTLRDSRVGANGELGIYKNGTTAMNLENCLVTGHASDGLQLVSGTVTISQSTVADNGGYGINNTGSTLTLDDSIVWGNVSGGINGLVTANYVNNQETIGSGTGNRSEDPRFVAGYYLSVNGLPYQSADSTSIGAGSDTAAALGVGDRSTRTDGTVDTGTADLGYHYAAGVQASNLVLYVNPSTGVESNDGWTSGAAIKTLTNAMARAINGSTIRLAAGIYSAASTEGFPITVSRENLRLVGTNRVSTVIDAGGTQRAFSASARGTLWIEGLTVTNGVPAYDSILLGYPGGGALLLGCRTVVTNCLFVRNRRTANNILGGAMYVNGGSLTVRNSEFVENGLPSGTQGNSKGSALWLTHANSDIRDSVFTGNRIDIYNSGQDGGVLFASGGSHWISGSTFQSNIYHTSASGGLLSFWSATGLTVSNSIFGDNTLNVRSSSGIIQVSGTAPADALITGCTFDNNLRVQVLANGNAIHMGASSGTLTVRDSVFDANKGQGIIKNGTSTLDVFNCLLYGQESHAVQSAAGTLTLRNSTLTENLLWGVSNSAATVTMTDTIVWNNTAGGVGGTVSATYCNSQNALSGTSNLSANPLFVPPFFHLSAAALQGGSDSPCINTGSDLASNLGLGLAPWTTRTDGGVDSGQVDMGYHYTNGTGAAVIYLTLYVDAVNGDDGNDGDEQGLPLKTITAALGKISGGGTIHVAAGTYNTALGETLPLTLGQNNLSLIGTNRALTLIDGGGVGRLLQADSKGTVWLEGMTFTNGYHSSQGAGLHLVTTQTTITNCVLIRNGIFTGGTLLGGAIYASGGYLTVLDSELTGNGSPSHVGGSSARGGAIWASGTAVTLDGCLFRGNAVNGYANGGGGCLDITGGSAAIRNCQFHDNHSQANIAGGVLHLSNPTGLSISNSIFSGNMMHSSYLCGIVYISGTASGMEIRDCVLTNNTIGNATGGMVQSEKSAGSLGILNTIIGRNDGHGIGQNGAGTLGVTNTLVHHQDTHGMRISAGTVTLMNATLANNGGWGVTNSAGTVTVKNSVVWGNASGGITGATVSFTDSQEVNAGTGNLNTDPIFTDAAVFDFSLKSSSPCVNKGDNEAWMETSLDLAGAKRRISAHVDMGAYESSGARGSLLMFR